MVMEKLKLPPLSQLAKVVVFLVLLVLIPFISTSLRPSYLYFLLNILILVVGVEAGFLRAISAPREEKKPTTAAAAIAASPANVEAGSINMNTTNSATDVDNLHLEKCSSRPSLFFIGSLGGEERVKEEEDKEEVEEEEEEEEWKEVGEMSKQELFTKAEMFIGNFYTQLKMQREESWKKLHELYHRAF